ncbi:MULTISPECIES: phosphoribosyl-ATP diphosphatase [unclassified Bosea (in: a-proteobacteria)]|uniref:phosphoribosyl-ATP diphosphatase n=1 Tax=unclassified Bosea (in: a-proteobacteria) TaxID=2653178 RepID=UPI000955B3D3|nr:MULTISPECIES: phosphoribosyl-ATP diphosphatase [unclassified Bosea (in: a-proteobacteria)]TAJ27975.1 MAG: phosphoribosyl-ATP diphosphatase [Bosea sp. (in: a-proteobacteria)]SIR03371.1 phosphoribosyl-ATP pyrophosphatase [Bosea sp. TND4EK4]
MADSIARLHAAVLVARQRDPRLSRTAKLFADGLPKMAKKVAEEAVEVGIEAIQGHRRDAIAESADLIYNLVVLWSAMGIAPGEVWAELDRREALHGIAEKLPKDRTAKRAKALLAREPADAA